MKASEMSLQKWLLYIVKFALKHITSKQLIKKIIRFELERFLFICSQTRYQSDTIVQHILDVIRVWTFDNKFRYRKRSMFHHPMEYEKCIAAVYIFLIINYASEIRFCHHHFSESYITTAWLHWRDWLSYQFI